jgi:hypothetical protein
MKSKREVYVEATKEIFTNSMILKKHVNLPDLNQLYDNLVKIFEAINNLTENDLSSVKIQSLLLNEIFDENSYIPHSLNEIIRMIHETLPGFYMDCLVKNSLNPTGDEKTECYESLLSKFPVNDECYQIISFIKENYLKKLVLESSNESLFNFCFLILERDQSYIPSEKIANSEQIVEGYKDHLQFINKANLQLESYQTRLEEKIRKDYINNQVHYITFVNLPQNKPYRDSHPDIYSLNMDKRIKAITEFLSQKNIRQQLIEKEEGVILPRAKDEFSSEIIDDLERYNIALAAKIELNNPEINPVERMKNTCNLIMANETILTKSRDSFYKTLIKGLLAVLTLSIAIPFLFKKEDKDVVDFFDIRHSFFNKKRNGVEREDPSPKESPEGPTR